MKSSIHAVSLLGLGLTLTSCFSDYELVGGVDVNPGDVTECAFTPVSGTKISEYDCNPVFPEDGEDGVGSIGFHVTEVLGHPFYQMWYGSGGGVDYAVSNNGTSWERVSESPLFELDSGAWDEDAFANQVVVWDPIDAQYVMAYQGFSYGSPTSSEDDQWGIGITTSVDGVEWTKHPNNPVIDFTDYAIPEQDYWDYFCSERASSPDFCAMIGVTYSQFDGPSTKMLPCWPLTMTITRRGNFRGFLAAKTALDVLESMAWEQFEADIWAYGSAGVGIDYYPACHVYSMDAMTTDNWLINDNQPILEGDSGSYDAGGIASAAVVEFEDTLYMFYLGFAVWTEDPVYEGVISGSQMSLNLATSTDDGVTWAKDPSNSFPVNRTEPGEMMAVGAQVVGSRIHFWLTDNYDGQSAVGYFYYEPSLEEDH